MTIVQLLTVTQEEVYPSEGVVCPTAGSGITATIPPNRTGKAKVERMLVVYTTDGKTVWCCMY